LALIAVNSKYCLSDAVTLPSLKSHVVPGVFTIGASYPARATLQTKLPRFGGAMNRWIKIRLPYINPLCESLADFVRRSPPQRAKAGGMGIY